jgi:predicted RNase H-like nuclease (RuvC/YqgF family)
MSDLYNYDFSDEEGDAEKSPKRTAPKEDDGEDEQHTQKINGMIESYQKQLSDIQDRLEAEKQANELLKVQLSEAASARNSVASDNNSTEVNTLKNEIARLNAARDADKLNFEAELAKAKASSGPSSSLKPAATANGVSRAMKTEIINMCRSVGIDMDGDENALLPTEKDCIQALRQAVQKKSKIPARSASPKARPATGAAATDSELQTRISNLEEELRLALGAAEDIKALKAKVIQLVDRLRVEKEERVKADGEVKRYSRKMEMLGDHIEKLMLHLKHEAGIKIKTSDQLRDSEKRNIALQAKLLNLTKKNQAKDRLVAELREGSKILEDQLRLMDEKYLELRTKLDYTRDTGAKKIKKAQKMAADLRVKFALAGNTTLLDHIPLPSSAHTAPVGSARGSDGFELGALTGPRTQVEKLNKSKSTHKPQKGSSAWDSPAHLHGDQDEKMVLEKVRLLQGGKTEWTDDRIRELLESK